MKHYKESFKIEERDWWRMLLPFDHLYFMKKKLCQKFITKCYAYIFFTKCYSYICNLFNILFLNSSPQC